MQAEIGGIANDGRWLIQVPWFKAGSASQFFFDQCNSGLDRGGESPLEEQGLELLKSLGQQGFLENGLEAITKSKTSLLADRINDQDNAKIIPSRNLLCMKSAVIDQPKTKVWQSQAVRKSADIGGHEALGETPLKIIQHGFQMPRMFEA
jgi:hypothetical protein